MIGVIDYGLGNIRAFETLYRRENIGVCAVRAPHDIANCTKLILPGVGAFDEAMMRLQASGMLKALEDFALVRKGPLLGVCVGMQILGRSSEEGKLSGLGWIDGRVKRFAKLGLALPHMGWNDVAPVGDSRLFSGMEVDWRFYFLHSYYFECSGSGSVLAESVYSDFRFSCAIVRGNIFGVQFHPEKSHHWGLALLKNFAAL